MPGVVLMRRPALWSAAGCLVVILCALSHIFNDHSHTGVWATSSPTQWGPTALSRPAHPHGSTVYQQRLPLHGVAAGVPHIFVRTGRSPQSPAFLRFPAAAFFGACLGLSLATAAAALHFARRQSRRGPTLVLCAAAGKKPASKFATAVPSPRGKPARTVLLSGCPTSVSIAELQQRFPAAVEVALLPSPNPSDPSAPSPA
eukprot:EG_transcript_31580